jgi:tetratricopeptide (TPR) repeat protein
MRADQDRAAVIESLSDTALDLVELGKRPEAGTVCQDLLRLDPGNVVALQLLGEIALEEGRFEAARGFFQAVVAAMPNAAEAHRWLGAALLKLGFYEKALASYTDAIVLKTSFAEAYNDRGLVLLKLKRTDAALRDFEKAVALAPLYADARFNLGTAYLLANKFEEALASFEETIAINPDYPMAVQKRDEAARKAEGGKSVGKDLLSMAETAELRSQLIDSILSGKIVYDALNELKVARSLPILLFKRLSAVMTPSIVGSFGDDLLAYLNVDGTVADSLPFAEVGRKTSRFWSGDILLLMRMEDTGALLSKRRALQQVAFSTRRIFAFPMLASQQHVGNTLKLRRLLHSVGFNYVTTVALPFAAAVERIGLVSQGNISDPTPYCLDDETRYSGETHADGVLFWFFCVQRHRDLEIFTRA